MAAIREAIQHFWGDYQNGTCDLVTASITTNTAIQLVRRLEEDMEILANMRRCDQTASIQRIQSLFDCDVNEAELKD